MDLKKSEFLIGELAEICEISPITLRYYDKMKILKPDRICTETNYRYYSQEKIFFVLMIKYYKRIGFTLKEISILLNRTNLEQIQKYFTKKLEEIEGEIQKSYRKHAAVREWSHLINEGQDYLNNILPTSDVKIVNFPLRQVVASKVLINCNQERHDFDSILVNKQIVNTAEKYNLYCAGPVLLFYRDYKERIEGTFNELDIYVPIYDEITHSDSILDFGGFKAVSLVHIGTYADIHLSYLKLIHWCHENKILPLGSSIEKYLIDPWSTNDEQKYVTEIVLPISCK
ncbi:MerR family transcriptional regulator [Aminipila butyrica]|uniref:MerR family transcriptional regulator n=1 Tax=Aminipila butyrica TaxID=433296 RepID=A0A858BS36_9FIRM|nr:MerR family transcriptional regulator [Aminipila butyrica]QIB68771.1 MerR family transcriptional regulator [Aminipila butyrica]